MRRRQCLPYWARTPRSSYCNCLKYRLGILIFGNLRLARSMANAVLNSLQYSFICTQWRLVFVPLRTVASSLPFFWHITFLHLQRFYMGILKEKLSCSSHLQPDSPSWWIPKPALFRLFVQFQTSLKPYSHN